MNTWVTVAEVSGAVAVVSWGNVMRTRAPRAFWLTVGAPVAAVWVNATFRSVMDGCGLSVDPTVSARLTAKMSGRPARCAVPRRGLFRPNGTGFTLRLRMRPGQCPEDFAAASERLRHAWGARSVHVKADDRRPGWVELRVVAWDVLAKVPAPRPTAPVRPLTVRMGVTADGRPHLRDFRAVPHELVLGATQSGKSVYLRDLVAGLAPEPVALVGIDCKWGVELAPFAPRLSALATDPDEAEGVLSALVALMEDRYRLIRAAQHIAPDTPDADITSEIWGLSAEDRPVPIVVVVDEVAELFLTSGNKADDQRRIRLVTMLIRLAQLGRAAGIHLEICGQRFGSELGTGATMLRAQLTGRVCHRVNDESTAKMALGDIADTAVMAATSLPVERPGTAVVGDSSGGWSIIRTPYLSIGDAARLCAASADKVPDVPALAPFAPARTLALVPDTPGDVEPAISA